MNDRGRERDGENKANYNSLSLRASLRLVCGGDKMIMCIIKCLFVVKPDVVDK